MNKTRRLLLPENVNQPIFLALNRGVWRVSLWLSELQSGYNFIWTKATDIHRIIEPKAPETNKWYLEPVIHKFFVAVLHKLFVVRPLFGWQF